MAQNNLKKPLLIVGSEKILITLIQFFGNVILARLLSPEDYGIVAMVAIFIAISSLFIESGFGGSLIYYKDVGEKDYSTVFWFNFLMGIIIYLLLFSTSGLIANFYNVPRLSIVIKVIGLVLVFNSFGLIQYTILYKQLQFKVLAITSVTSTFLAFLVSICLGLYGLGLWALVANQVLYSVFQTITLCVRNKFIPRSFISIALLKKHWKYGSGMAFSSLVKTVYENIYLQIIGKFFTITSAGYFNQANKIKEIPVQLCSRTFDTSLFPIMSKCESKDEITALLIKTSSFFSFSITPLLFLLAITSKLVVAILLGDKWLESCDFLSLLAIGSIFVILESINRSVFKAIGLTKLFFKIELIKRIVNIGIILLFIYLFKIYGLAYSFILNSFIGWLVNSYALYYYSKISFKEQFFSSVKYFSVCLVLYALIKILMSSHLEISYWWIVSAGAIFVIVYLGIFIFAKDKNINYVKNIIKRKRMSL